LIVNLQPYPIAMMPPCSLRARRCETQARQVGLRRQGSLAFRSLALLYARGPGTRRVGTKERDFESN
jgi:hypothetical protein